MMINSLEKMTSIVDKNSSLDWDGWDVVERKANPTAWSKQDGIYINGKWYMQKKFALSTEGWEIPNKFVR